MGYALQHCLFAFFTLALGTYFFIAGSAMPRTASLFPKIMALLVVGLSLAMVVQAFSAARKQAKAPEAPSPKLHILRTTVYIVLIAAYIFLIPRLGYFIATPLFMMVSYLYLRATGFLKALLISLGFCIFIYLLFVWFLKLPIPMGYLETLLGS